MRGSERSSIRAGQKAVLLLLSLGLLISTIQPLLGASPISLLLPGDATAEYLPAKVGEGWLGLYRSGERFELKPTQVRIESVTKVLASLPPTHPLRQGMKDEGGGEFSFLSEMGRYRVLDTVVAIVQGDSLIWNVAGEVWDRKTLRRFDRSVVPLWLFQGLDASRPGPVATAFYDEENSFVEAGDDVRLRVGERAYQFLGVPSGNGGYSYVLVHGGLRQTLARFPRSIDNRPSLLWAGDLDRDGKLDLLLDLPEGDSGGNHHLFLSSRARPGNLVEDVAQRVLVGC